LRVIEFLKIKRIEMKRMKDKNEEGGRPESWFLSKVSELTKWFMGVPEQTIKTDCKMLLIIAADTEGEDVRRIIHLGGDTRTVLEMLADALGDSKSFRNILLEALLLTLLKDDREPPEKAVIKTGTDESGE
jgi:hypothetical protein